MADTDDKKRQKLDKNNIDDRDDDENPRMRTQSHWLTPQNSLDVMFGGEVLLSEVLPFLDVVSIVDKKIVCRSWKDKCDVVINSKGRQKKKHFVDNVEIRKAVRRYCEGDRDDIENIAEVYGYPIGRWDVSRLEDFSKVFLNMTSFNEDIGAWDVGNATNMISMFNCACSFNKSLSDWDVSNVKDMRCMFDCALAFNGDVSTWDTSRVTHMALMFWGAAAFDGDISSWNVSRVKDMRGMFARAEKFNRDRLNSIKVNWEGQGKVWW